MDVPTAKLLPKPDPRDPVTLFVGDSFSVCGNCYENADLGEARHETRRTLNGVAAGCGAEWKYITSAWPHVKAWRPDLEWRQDPLRQSARMGDVMERKTLGYPPLDADQIDGENHLN